MGIYVFAPRVLIDQLRRDAATPGLNRDFGKNLIPHLVQYGKAVIHRFPSSCVRSSAEAEAYWRDVGTLDADGAASIDLTHATPGLDLCDTAWPIWTDAEITPPAKVIQEEAGRRGEVINSDLSGGCIVDGAVVRGCLLFTGACIHPGAQLEEVVVLPGGEIAHSARLRKVIVVGGVRIPEALVVGEDRNLDRQRFRCTDSGVCLITQYMLDRLGQKILGLLFL